MQSFGDTSRPLQPTRAVRPRWTIRRLLPQPVLLPQQLREPQPVWRVECHAKGRREIRMDLESFDDARKYVNHWLEYAHG
jgi:hypothetical protein